MVWANVAHSERWWLLRAKIGGIYIVATCAMVNKIKRERSPTMTVKEFKKYNNDKYVQMYELLNPDHVICGDVREIYAGIFIEWVNNRCIDDMADLYRDSIE